MYIYIIYSTLCVYTSMYILLIQGASGVFGTAGDKGIKGVVVSMTLSL